jgi:TPR repeat protein
VIALAIAYMDDVVFNSVCSVVRFAGIPEAMNSLAILLEDGRAFADGKRELHQAAAWYYEACKCRYAKAYLNLAILLDSEDIRSFKTIDGNLVSLTQSLRFLETTIPNPENVFSAQDAHNFRMHIHALSKCCGTEYVPVQEVYVFSLRYCTLLICVVLVSNCCFAIVIAVVIVMFSFVYN